MSRRYVFFLSLFVLLRAPVVVAHPTFSSRSIVNAASFLPSEVKGGAIARGSIFTIFGEDIGPAGGVQAAEFPLQPSLAGVQVSVAQPGAPSVTALPLFVSAGQVNAIMPSNAPLGPVTIQIQFRDGDGGDASSPVRAEVVEASFGVFTATGRGVGPAIAFNFESEAEQPLNATTASARRGQVVVLWGTGLGAVPGGDAEPPGLVDLRASSQIEVWVGGAKVDNILYAGRSPLFAGLDQINFEIPAGAAHGCYSPVWVKVAGGRVSNVATLAVSDAPGACQDPVNPYLVPGAGSRVGLLQPRRARFESGGGATNVDTATGSFRDIVIREFFYNPALSLPPRGTCHVMHPGPSDPEWRLPHESPSSALEAGAMILQGPGGTREFTRTSGGFYESLLEGDYLVPGGYTLSSAGGQDVRAFTHSFDVTDSPTWRLNGDGVTVGRDQALTVNWSGGDPQTGLIRILGVVSSSELTSVRIRGMFVCTATPAQGILEIPADLLSNLPASVGSGDSSTARLYVGTSPMPEYGRFQADGLDFGAVLPIAMRGRPITVR